MSLLIAQLCLGFTAFLTRVAWGRDAVQPELPMVASTVAHVAVGALLLATAVILAIQVWSHVPVAFEERLPQAERDPERETTWGQPPSAASVSEAEASMASTTACPNVRRDVVN